jgi:hypothetical protein
MLRLGWLRLIARVLGAETISRGALATKLSELANANLETWLDAAGLKEKPRGLFSKVTPGRLPGVAERFGIYDATSEGLTDLGRVLYVADAAYKQIDSPFLWPTPLRYIGLRILLGADGDILLEVLRAWPQQGRLTRPLIAVGEAAFKLLDRADSQEQAGELRRIAAAKVAKGAKAVKGARIAKSAKIAKSEKKHSSYWEVTYPILEPFRELGYATRVNSGGEGGQYVLTPRGVALAAAVREGAWAESSADDILDKSLGKLFSTAEGSAVTEEASLLPIRETLVGLPDMLLGGMLSEAPLEPVVLLTEARLLSTGATTSIEVARTRAGLHELGRRTSGRVALKQGRMSGEANIAWSSPQDLRDAELFRIDQPPMEISQFSAAESPPTAPPSPPPAMEAPLAPPAVEEPLADPVTEAPSADPIAAKQPAATSLSSMRAEFLRLLGERGTNLPTAPSPIPARVVLWLEYVGRLLEEPTLGAPDLLSTGAPSSWIERLRLLVENPLYLSKKRKQDDLPWPKGTGTPPAAAGTPPAAYLLARWCEGLSSVASLKPLRDAASAWSDEHTSIRLLRVALDRAKEAWEGTITRDLRERIEKFLDDPQEANNDKAWNEVQLLTSAWLQDLIERNLAPREDLKRRLHDAAHDGLSRRVANALFEAEGEIRRMIVSQTFQVTRAMASYVEGEKAIEVGLSPASVLTIESVRDIDENGFATVRSNALRVTVEVGVSSRELAVARAAESAWDALKKVRLIAGASKMAAPRSDDGIAAQDSPEVTVNGVDVPAVEPTHAIARLTLAPKFPRSTLQIFTIKDLISADHPRLSRTLHWLAVADQAGLDPANRIFSVWVAMEHSIVEHEEHGPAVARTLADVGALCRVEALAGYVSRELCEALRHTRFRRGTLTDVSVELGRWESPIRNFLGQTVRDAVYDDKRTEPAGFTDDAALRFLLSRETSDLKALLQVISEDTPSAAFAIRYWSHHIVGTHDNLATWLRTTRREIQSLVLHAYEIRNLLFHDGRAFGFEDAARLQNLYARFRLVVDAVVSRFATALVLADSPDVAPGVLWAPLRIGVRDLLHPTHPPANSSPPVDRNALGRAILVI